MVDSNMIVRGCENWVKNHKGEQLLLEYSAVEDLLAVLKEQEAVVRCKCGWRYCPSCGARMNGVKLE